jgi:hypothetical protein
MATLIHDHEAWERDVDDSPLNLGWLVSHDSSAQTNRPFFAEDGKNLKPGG